MATRFYLPSSGVAAISPTFDAIWAFGDTARHPLVTETTGTPMVQKYAAETAASTTNVRWAQYVSAPLAAQQIVGQMSMGVVYSGGNNSALRCIAKVVSNDGGALIGTLASFVDPAGNGGFNDSRQITVGLSTVTAPEGARIVIELGYLTNNTIATSRSESIFLGDPHFAGSYLKDTSTHGETQYINGDRASRPWIQFTQTLFPQQVKVSKFSTEALLKPYEARISKVQPEALLKPINGRVSRIAPEVLHRPVEEVTTPNGRPIYILLPSGWRKLTHAPKYL